MTDMVRGVLEDSRKGLLFNDFSGGLCTDTGGLSLAANQTPDSLNVFAWEGSLHFRGGYSQYSTLPGAADGAFTYYDINGNAHMVEWAAGNMYDVSSATPVTIASGVYTPGQTIAHAQLNGILYWATATVPLRQWNGVTEQAVPNSGGVGTVPPPSCEFLVDFQGSLVAVNFTTTAGAQHGAFIWSNVNDPTTWVGANTQTVGSNDGGVCTFALLMGIAQVGVTPTKQFMVGKSNNQIFLYLGALGSLTENAVSSPVGIRDGASAVYIPTQQGLGAVMFLGDDGLFYLTNGIECPVASNNIKLLTNNLVNTALQQNSDQRFNAVYNQRFQYYMCDFGNNTQLVYKWDTAAWWYFQGWPSGVYTTFPTTTGLPTIFVGANYGSTTGVYELAIDQTNDNGSAISAYWSSPYVHGGKPERLKLFQECTVFAYNVGCQYALTAYGLPQSNGVTPVTKTSLLNDPAVGAYPSQPTQVALWGQAVWGQSLWGGGSGGTIMQPYAIGGMKTPLIVPSGISKWGPAGYPLPLRTGGAQFKIAWNAGVPDFRITAFKVSFLFQNENVGILPYSNQGQVVTNFNSAGQVAPGDKFTNTGLPLPLDLPASGQPGSAFFPLPGQVQLNQFWASDNIDPSNNITLSPDGTTLNVLCSDPNFNNDYVINVSTITGQLIAQSPSLSVSDNCIALFQSATTGNLYVLTQGGAITALNPSTLAVISTATSGALGLRSCYAISDDGLKIAVSSSGTCLLYDVDSASFSSFAINSGQFGGGITFGLNDHAHIFLADWATAGLLVEYDLLGNVDATYATGVTSTHAIIQALMFSTSGTIFGTNNPDVGDPSTPSVFAYDIGTSTLLTNQVITSGAGIFAAARVPNNDAAMYFRSQDFGAPNGGGVYKLTEGGLLTFSPFIGGNEEGGNEGGLAVFNSATQGIIYTQVASNADNATLVLEAIGIF